jgi:hypothetical protein
MIHFLNKKKQLNDPTTRPQRSHCKSMSHLPLSPNKNQQGFISFIWLVPVCCKSVGALTAPPLLPPPERVGSPVQSSYHHIQTLSFFPAMHYFEMRID